MLDSASLTLLTTEGMLRITFRPALTTPQYQERCDLITRSELRTRQQFRDLLARHANEWGVAFESEGLDRL